MPAQPDLNNPLNSAQDLDDVFPRTQRKAFAAYLAREGYKELTVRTYLYAVGRTLKAGVTDLPPPHEAYWKRYLEWKRMANGGSALHEALSALGLAGELSKEDRLLRDLIVSAVTKLGNNPSGELTAEEVSTLDRYLGHVNEARVASGLAALSVPLLSADPAICWMVRYYDELTPRELVCLRWCDLVAHQVATMKVYSLKVERAEDKQIGPLPIWQFAQRRWPEEEAIAQMLNPTSSEVLVRFPGRLATVDDVNKAKLWLSKSQSTALPRLPPLPDAVQNALLPTPRVKFDMGLDE